MLLVKAKLIVLEYLQLLIEKVGWASRKIQKSYEWYFNNKVRHRSVSKTEGWVYTDKPPNLTIRI